MDDIPRWAVAVLSALAVAVLSWAIVPALFRRLVRRLLADGGSRERQSPSLAELERQEAARREQQAPLLYVACFAAFLLIRVLGSDRPADWVAWPVGILVGAASAHAAFRYLGLGRTAARSIWVASAVGLVTVMLGTPLLLGLPVFPPPLATDIPTPINVVHGVIEGLLIGVLVIAVEKYRRSSPRGHRTR